MTTQLGGKRTVGAQRRDEHHFSPRHLLKQFQNSRGRVCFNRRSAGWRASDSGPKRIGREQHFYSPGVRDLWGREAKDDIIEVWLEREVDTPAAGPIRMLVEGADVNTLTRDQRHAIANFVAVLDMRTPVVRDLLSPQYAIAARDSTRDRRAIHRDLKAKGVRVTLGEISQKRKEMIPLLERQGKAGWLVFIQQQSSQARQTVHARLWTMLDAPPGTEFITSDVAIVKAPASFARPTNWELGNMGMRFQWLIPLSPHRALAVTDKNLPRPTQPTEATMSVVNRRFVLDAREFVYSRTPLDPAIFNDAPSTPSEPRESIEAISRIRIDETRVR